MTTRTVKKNGKPLGMAWYKFLRYFALAAAAIMNFFSGVGYLTGSVYMAQTDGEFTATELYAYYGDVLKATDITYGIVLFCLAVLAIVLRDKLANYKPDTLKYVCIYYSLVAGAPFVYNAFTAVMIASQPIAVDSVITLVCGLIVLLMNVRYFKRRAHLFVDEELSVQPAVQAPMQNAYMSAAGTTEHVALGHQRISFCWKCGAKLFDNSTFCHNCGTKLAADEN